MICLARHVNIIVRQLKHVTRHAVAGCISDDAASRAAMKQIAATLRRCADEIDVERERREASAKERAKRNAILWGESKQ